jgi:predicted NBD/HSP70 family sugar kinase
MSRRLRAPASASALDEGRGGAEGFRSTRDLNRFRVVSFLREHPRASRVEIANELQLSTATLTHIAGELMELGYVCEVGTTQSVRGRHPILLELNRAAGYVVGVEMEHLDCCNVGLFDLGCELVCQREQHLRSTGPQDIAAAVGESLHGLLAESGLARDQLLAAGVSSPGVVAADTGTVVRAAKMGWHDVPLRRVLEAALDIPVFVDNETNLSALGEYRYGRYRGSSELIYIDVGPGVGAGLIFGGQLFHGASGSAGEVGHMVVQADGPPCICGARGCLEALISQSATLRWIDEQLAGGAASALQREPRGGLGMQAVYDAINTGDALALAALERIAFYLSQATSSLINLLSPSIVILGGEVGTVAGQLAARVAVRLGSVGLTEAARMTPVVPTSLGRAAPLIVAASLALEQVFSIPVFNIRS